MGLVTLEQTNYERAHSDESKPPSRQAVNVGEIISVSGSKAKVLLARSPAEAPIAEDATPFIGTVLTVDTGNAVVVCLVTSMSATDNSSRAGLEDFRVMDVELAGELKRETDGYLRTFKRGVTVYPRLGDKVSTANDTVLGKVYEFNSRECIQVGRLHLDPSIPAFVKTNEMLGKHFAVVGSTGTGKSCTVALLLRQVLSGHPNAHVILLDPHNEYGTCFGEWTEQVKINDLTLPYWLLTFEEAAEILVGNADQYGEEIEILRELIPVAKRNYASPKSGPLTMRETARGHERFSVDVPVPYRIADVLQLLEVEMGRLEKTRDISKFKRLKARISTISQDPRYAFMFGSYSANDNLEAIIKRIFRIPVKGRPISVIEMMGLPGEVVNVLVSVLARLAFDVAMWSEGRIPVTFVCEEAHRYVPRSTDQGFEPTKRAISRIAKEGRKYGASLCIVSQRPGDLDPTILSQCSTIFTMRLSNEHDQAIIESALADASSSLLDFLPSLGTRECVVFGEGVTLPSRVILSELPVEALPKGHTAHFADAWSQEVDHERLLGRMIAKWRHTDRSSGRNQATVAASLNQPGVQSETAPMVTIAERLQENFGGLVRS